MRKLMLSLVAVALMAPLALAQIDFNIMGTGARARGMGGAFIGVADDATAVGWNPAGIAQLDKMEASAVGLFNITKYKGEINFPSISYSDSWDEGVTHFAPSFGSFILPFKMSDKNLVLGLAYQRLIDFGMYDKDDSTYYGSRWESTDKTTGGIDAITPAIAYQITPQFMVGGTGNIIVRGTHSEYEVTFLDSTSWSYSSEEDWNYSGFFMGFGALASMQKFNIGASLKLPFTLTESGEESWKGNFGTAFSGDTTYPDNEFTMPMMLGFGMAIKPSDKLTLAADFEMRGYSSTEMTYKYYNTSGQLADTTVKLGWNNCNQFRVGLEYVFSGPNAVFPVRLGFRTDPRVYDKTEGTFSAVDTPQAVGKTFTAGFGLMMGSLMLDLSYELGMANLTDIEDPNGTVKEDQTSHNIMASIIYHFK